LAALVFLAGVFGLSRLLLPVSPSVACAGELASDCLGTGLSPDRGAALVAGKMAPETKRAIRPARNHHNFEPKLTAFTFCQIAVSRKLLETRNPSQNAVSNG